MFKISVFLLALCGLLMTEAVPQYGPPSAASPAQSQPAQSAYGGRSQSAYGGAARQPQQAQSSYGGAGESRQAQASYGGAGQSQQAPSAYGGAASQPQQAQPSYGGAASQPQQAQSSYGGAASQPQQAQPSYGGAASQPQHAQPSYGGAASQPQQAQPSYSGAASQPQQAQPSYGGAASQPQQAQSSYGGAASQPQQAQSSYGGAGQSQPAQSSYGGARSDLTVQCKATPGPYGSLKYDCSGINPDAITLKTEHILWLESESQKPQNLDIQIPNYSIDEFIKAAFKPAPPNPADKINILLKKPYVSYNAQKDDAPKPQIPQPDVKVNYQPIEKVSVHYPTQKQYQQNSGSSAAGTKAAAPASYSASPYSRPRRQTEYSYFIITQ